MSRLLSLPFLALFLHRFALLVVVLLPLLQSQITHELGAARVGVRHPPTVRMCHNAGIIVRVASSALLRSGLTVEHLCS